MEHLKMTFSITVPTKLLLSMWFEELTKFYQYFYQYKTGDAKKFEI